MIMIAVTSNYIIVWVLEPIHLCLCSSFALWIAHLALCFHLCKGEDGKELSSLDCDKVSCCLTLIQGSCCGIHIPNSGRPMGHQKICRD